MSDTPTGVVDISASHRVQGHSSHAIRTGDHEIPPVAIPALVEGIVTVIAGAGGSGKTVLAEQIARHVTHQKRLGSFELPDDPMTVWLWFLEDIPYMAQDRSLRVAGLGELDEDTTGVSPVTYYTDRGHGIASVQAELEAAAEEDRIPHLLVIDYLRLLVGPKPSGYSVNDWEAGSIRRLRDLGVQYGCQIVVLTHTNKEGRVSGTTDLTAAADAALKLEVNAEDRACAVLRAEKMRMAPETDYALGRKSNGTWGFTDELSVSEAQATGIARDILAVLRSAGPHTLSQLVDHRAIDGTREGIRTALRRLKKRGEVRTYRGHWEWIPSDGDAAMAPPAPAPAPEPVCSVCGLAMTLDDGTGTHPTCLPRPVPAPRSAEVIPAQHGAEPEVDYAADAAEAAGRRWDGYAALEASIRRSRMHPLPRVKGEHREEAPWTLVDNRMVGDHSARVWSRPAPDGAMVAVLDRNGSFPSAMSSVPVCANRMRHTGALGTVRDREGIRLAGLFRIEVPAWEEDGIGHPLGRLAEADGPVWITAPHLEHLDRLAKAGRIAPVDVLDSWTGRRSTSLFQHFSRWAKDAREEARAESEEDYTEVKRTVSRAIRSLSPVRAPSPFWRPDWHRAVVAEANVRHWAVADRAVRAGAELLALGNTDECAWVIPAGEDPAAWTPPGYVLGDAYGQVKHKEIGTPDGKVHMSPVTAEIYNGRGRKRKAGRRG